MQIRPLGKQGPDVGAVGLGCMPMSWAYGIDDQDEATSIAVLERALELGVTHWDTAALYGVGDNETLIAKVLNRHRDQVAIATKCGLICTDRATFTIERNGRPESVLAELDASLQRLGTDHVDLWYLHRVDPTVPLAETWGAMATAVAAGKVRQLGLSEVTLDQANEANATHPVGAVQSELSLWTRDALGLVQEPRTDVEAPPPTDYQGGGVAPQDMVSWCADNGAAFVAFSPLGRGFLTGQLTTVAAKGDFRSNNPRFQPQSLTANQVIVDAVQSVANRLSTSAARVAIAWVLSRGQHVLTIPGTKRVKWLEQNATASDVTLSEADLAELDAIPAAVGTRY